MRRPTIAVSLAFFALLVSGTMWAAPAVAADPANCVVLLEPSGPASADGVVSAVPVDLGCYPTYAAALAAGSDGAIQTPPAMTPSALTDATLRADTDADASPAAGVLIGTEWTGSGFTNASNSYFAASTCTSSTTWQVGYVTDAWNDVFNSGKGFGGCDVNKKFANSNFGGAVVTCTPNCGDYGSLDDQVSSLRWRV